MNDRDLGLALLAHARAAIGAEFGILAEAPRGHIALVRPGATFVTLTQGGELRGCIGSLEARRALEADVRANAVAAAFRDPRFPPLQRREFEATWVEVSLLSAATRIDCENEDELLAGLRPGVDGVVIECGFRRATFLPQVWESLPEPRDFLAALKRKAGLPGEPRGAALTAWRYTVTKWKESEFTTESERS
jgi:AmmeMemoRadiSam system protein A